MVKDKNTLSLKERILKYLIESDVDSVTIRQISQDLRVDYKNTFQVIDNISELISKKRIGNSNLIKIKIVPNQEIFSVENKRTHQFLKENRQLELLKQDIEGINYPFFIVLIFGSYVKKTNTKKSDLDICIIYDNKERINKFISKLELLPFKLEIHDFTIDEFEKMLKTKEDNIGKEIVKNNIILYGLENYYNLISKWMKKD